MNRKNKPPTVKWEKVCRPIPKNRRRNICVKEKRRNRQLSAYTVELQISYSVGNSILDDTSPVIYQKGKIMYHLDLPYHEMCDSDHYSLCPKVPQTDNIRANKSGCREYNTETMRIQGSRNNRGRSVSGSYTSAGKYPTEV